MKRAILTSTAVDPVGKGLSRHLYHGPDGRYVNRMVAIIHAAANLIVLTYADPPYVSWTAPVNVAVDAADLPFDTVMTPDGTIHIVYTEDTTNYLVTRPFTFANGQWTPGLKATIYDGAISQSPSIIVKENGDLWVSWTRSAGAVKYLHVKSSIDAGVTWGAGASDAGTQLTAGASSVVSQLITAPDNLHLVYNEADWNLYIRTRPDFSGSWESAYLIAGSDVNGSDFDAAISKSGILGVVFNRYGLQYREYDGSIWSAILTLDPDGGSSPHLQFQSDMPIVSYLSTIGAGGRAVQKFVTRSSGSFGNPELMDKHTGAFAKVIVYATSSESYHDATAAAANDNIGDLYHPATNTLFQHSGDAIYLGLAERFRLVRISLATAGIGGTVGYSYWDGSSWVSFEPASGMFHLDTTEQTLSLWDDYHSIPANWQQSIVNGSRHFWIKVETLSSFSTAPVGTRVDAASQISGFALRR